MPPWNLHRIIIENNVLMLGCTIFSLFHGSKCKKHNEGLSKVFYNFQRGLEHKQAFVCTVLIIMRYCQISLLMKTISFVTLFNCTTTIHNFAMVLKYLTDQFNIDCFTTSSSLHIYWQLQDPGVCFREVMKVWWYQGWINYETLIGSKYKSWVWAWTDGTRTNVINVIV